MPFEPPPPSEPAPPAPPTTTLKASPGVTETVAVARPPRPPLSTPRLFITEAAPVRPLTRIAIKCIVRRTLLRAGIKSAHQGAHVLRHSAATTMLRHGVSLTGVGAVLRHRSPAMTMHYAKVDFALLSEIAQPWIGRLPC